VNQMIVRDLWAYQLAISPLPPVPEPEAVTGQADQATTSLIPTEQVDEDSRSEDDKADEEAVRTRSGSSKSDDEAGIDSDLLAELSEDSTDKEEHLREITPGAEQRSDTRWRRKRRLRVSDTVVTFVVALWVMRVPVLNVEVERCVKTGDYRLTRRCSSINENQIPYIDFGHTSLLPAEMAKHMNRDIMIALCPIVRLRYTEAVLTR
jgi:RNA polymerase I-specific transcription initiation factor RRN7